MAHLGGVLHHNMYTNKTCTRSAASALLLLHWFSLITVSLGYRTQRHEPHQNRVVRKINTWLKKWTAQPVVTAQRQWVYFTPWFFLFALSTEDDTAYHHFLVNHSFEQGMRIGRVGCVKLSIRHLRHYRRSLRWPISLCLPGNGSGCPLSPGGMASSDCLRFALLKFVPFSVASVTFSLLSGWVSRNPKAPRMCVLQTCYLQPSHPSLPISDTCLLS